MVLNHALCQLGEFLEEWPEDGTEIRSVTVSDKSEFEGEQGISAEMLLEVPAPTATDSNEDVIECEPAVATDGTLEFVIETNIPMRTGGYVVDAEPVDATLQTDGTAVVTVHLTVSENSGSETVSAVDEQSRESAAEGTPGGSETTSNTQEVPPFRDTELLQEVYDTNDTFAEMADALEMDVTGETVRRYMIDHDIHQPNSYRENGKPNSPASPEGTTEDDGDEMVVLSDGIGLPDGVTVDALIETVSRSNTIYEVKEDLGLERMEAHTMLKELNMVDLVLGRLSNDTSHDITREDVIDRLREVSQAQVH